MGERAKGFLPTSVKTRDIKKALEEIFGIVGTINRMQNLSNYEFLYIKDKSAERQLNVHLNYNDHDYKDIGKCTLISLSTYGEGPKIIKAMVSHFGGYYLANDSSGKKPKYLQ